jgi:hypothetical protein
MAENSAEDRGAFNIAGLGARIAEHIRKRRKLRPFSSGHASYPSPQP